MVPVQVFINATVCSCRHSSLRRAFPVAGAYMERFTFGHYLLTVFAYIETTIKNAINPSFLPRFYLLTVPPLWSP